MSFQCFSCWIHRQRDSVHVKTPAQHGRGLLVLRDRGPLRLRMGLLLLPRQPMRLQRRLPISVVSVGVETCQISWVKFAARSASSLGFHQTCMTFANFCPYLKPSGDWRGGRKLHPRKYAMLYEGAKYWSPAHSRCYVGDSGNDQWRPCGANDLADG